MRSVAGLRLAGCATPADIEAPETYVGVATNCGLATNGLAVTVVALAVTGCALMANGLVTAG